MGISAFKPKEIRAVLDFSSPAGKMTVKHKQEAAGQTFRGVAGQPLQCRGSVTKHEGGEKGLALCRLSGFLSEGPIYMSIRANTLDKLIYT